MIQNLADPIRVPTQYHKSTAHATYIRRRIQDWSEQKGAELHLAVLDWEKAFAKVKLSKLLDAIRRLGFTDKYVQTIQNIYASPTFFVQDLYGSSQVKTRSSGIRQGCPLMGTFD